MWCVNMKARLTTEKNKHDDEYDKRKLPLNPHQTTNKLWGFSLSLDFYDSSFKLSHTIVECIVMQQVQGIMQKLRNFKQR